MKNKYRSFFISNYHGIIILLRNVSHELSQFHLFIYKKSINWKSMIKGAYIEQCRTKHLIKGLRHRRTNKPLGRAVEIYE